MLAAESVRELAAFAFKTFATIEATKVASSAHTQQGLAGEHCRQAELQLD